MSTRRDKKRSRTTKRKPSIGLLSFQKCDEKDSDTIQESQETVSETFPVFINIRDSEDIGVADINTVATGDILKVIENSQTDSDILTRAEANKFKVYICPNITSVYLDDPSILYTNMVCSSSGDYATKVRNEVINLTGFDNSVKSGGDIPIDLDIDEGDDQLGHFLINEQTTTRKRKRYQSILDHHSSLTGATVDIDTLEKFEFLDTISKKRTGHRLLVVKDDTKRTIYVHFLDPHHLFATDFNTKVKVNFPKYSGFKLNISDIIT